MNERLQFTPQETIEQEILFLRDQIKALERMQGAIRKQVLHMETRIDDLRKVASPAPREEERT